MKRAFFIFLVVATLLTGCSMKNEIRVYSGDVKNVDKFTMSETFISVSRFSETEIIEIAKVTVEQKATIYEGWFDSRSFYVRRDNNLYKFGIFNKENIKEFDHARNTFLYDTTWLKKDGFGRTE
jgi:hypothetical protein